MLLLRTLIPRNLVPYTKPIAPLRSFTTTFHLTDKPLPPRLKIDDADLTISYLKGTGPGGQKINKTNSAVQLIHKPTGLVVKSQATRSRSQNEKIARQILADKVEQAEKGDQSRAAIKADRARKKKASKVKKSRRKYRELGKGQEEVQEQEDRDGEEGHQELVGVVSSKHAPPN
ncbi:RF-1 domain-containing protein [Aspergillus pseudonomiae]|uniref:RF-1 domain-containing protein n=1 Tax=Aspergillus pseudonomiae TaxID=1506151 RepID=A0A5N7DHA0_9EURO|nr:RF-1 domain-containing protein [Aspergillus pseudonomiae]KAE8405812.1 RF-1 domain-containing protein [Aspergillus pseudonomiae]